MSKDLIFPELFAWQCSDGTVETKVLMTPEEEVGLRRLEPFSEALKKTINKVEDSMSKYYVIRYRNAPESKGMDKYLWRACGDTCGPVKEALTFPTREAAEDFLLLKPRLICVATDEPDPVLQAKERQHYLMADIAIVEHVDSTTVRGL